MSSTIDDLLLAAVVELEAARVADCPVYAHFVLRTRSVSGDDDSTTSTQPYSPLVTEPGSPLATPETALIEALEEDLNRLTGMEPVAAEFVYETPDRPQVAPTHAIVVARNGLKRRRLNMQ
jgi:hypothetical protein